MSNKRKTDSNQQNQTAKQSQTQHIVNEQQN